MRGLLESSQSEFRQGDLVMAMIARRVLASARGCALAAALLASGPAHANAIKNLDGYWTGTGSVQLTNGQSEQVRCVVTYRVEANLSGVRQSLRCASAAYKINARAEIKIAGNAVTGQWEETNYAAKGDVTGQVLDTGFQLAIKAPTFSAAMKVASQACKQTIDIEPTGLDVAKISITLSKC
jgi:hypothetical protein